MFSGLHRGFLARNHTQQNTLDGVELRRVDERVGADVEKRNEQKRVVAG